MRSQICYTSSLKKISSPADDVGLVGEGVVGREDLAVALALAEDLLVALRAPDVLGVRLDEVCQWGIENKIMSVL